MNQYPRTKSPVEHAKEKGVSKQLAYRKMEPPIEPEMDSEGYPTEKTLKVIQNWNCNSNWQIRQLMDYVEKCWRHEFKINHGGTGSKRWFRTATHGWSGNELIIIHLQLNFLFWGLCWLESRRGGGFKFLKAPLVDKQP